MKKTFLLALLAVTALFLSGCFINITAMTKINDDGSGFRITTYTADGASEKEEVLDRYILPPGGEWRLTQYIKNAPPQHIYEAKRTFTDIKGLVPDYVRKGSKAGDVSANKFSLKINKGIIFTTYEYEETFRDCTDAGKIKKFFTDWYDHLIEVAAGEVERAFPKTVKKEAARALLGARYRPYFDYFLTSFTTDGRGALDGRDKKYQMKVEEYEKEYSVENFSSFFADHIISLDKGADRKAVTEKLMAVHASIDKQISDYSAELGERNYDDAFGVYGWPIFMGYTFNISVVMPGRITEANTGEIKSNVAKWEFTDDDFLLKEYNLQAKSRKLNPAGIGILSAFFLIALFIAYKRGNKRN